MIKIRPPRRKFLALTLIPLREYIRVIDRVDRLIDILVDRGIERTVDTTIDLTKYIHMGSLIIPFLSIGVGSPKEQSMIRVYLSSITLRVQRNPETN